jgi:hypothetical protein
VLQAWDSTTGGRKLWHTQPTRPFRTCGTPPAIWASCRLTKSHKRVWLRCPGCIHECGTHHEWQARICDLTKNAGRIVCPFCESRGRGGRFCECQSIANEPRISNEWHSSNPPASQVAKNSNSHFLWECRKGHPVYKNTTCYERSCHNTGCPVCGIEKCKTPHHPVVSIGRPDLAGEWDHQRNSKLPSEVTLGSTFRAWWVCRNPEHPSWQARVKSRALRGSGCPACSVLNRFKPRGFGTG